MSENPVNSNSAPETVVDPVVLVTIGEEVYQLIYDFNVAKEITRWTGVSPILQGLHTAMATPDGLEICLWAMISKMGLKHDVPSEQRAIKLEEVKYWFQDSEMEDVDGYALAMVEAFNRSRAKGKKDVPQDPNSLPQTKVATT